MALVCSPERNIDQTNILVKNVNARVFTNQMWMDGQRTKTNHKTSPEQSDELKTIFQLVQEINKTNAKYVTSIVKTAPTPWQPYIYKTNLFTKFHDNWAKNKTAPLPGSHVIQLTGTIFQLNSHIKETKVLTKFHENWAKNIQLVTKFGEDLMKFWDRQTDRQTNIKNAPPTGGHVFSPI
ncbi:hypothetical protein DPMN_026696 [Dreissena polymorpha]|uniref:Uncharacterized protein n=1 Tax=Dreissena polymorpha TaxID=45954 RepID=A0A9D4LTH0_DREPO|nr:hypothetical protein DPMN_026696 [Dreissena polymorpha]